MSEDRKQQQFFYLRRRRIDETMNVVNEGREVIREAESKLAAMEVINRYVTLDKVI